MPYIGNEVGNRFVASKAASVYSGNGSTTAFTLEHAVGSDEDILVSVDGVIQEPSVAYAVSSGTTLTFTAAPSSNSGNNIFVYYLFRTVATVDHPSTSSLQATDATFTGAVTANSGVNIDNITIDGTEIDLSSGDLTIDVAGDIVFDADGGDIFLKDGGTNIGQIALNNSGYFDIYSAVQDADVRIRGNDGGSTITALTLDMSDAGTAIFNHDILTGLNANIDIRDADGHVSGRLRNVSGSNNALTIEADPDNSASGTYISFKVDTTEVMKIDNIGAVTKPYQPAFQVNPASNQLNLANADTLVFGQEKFDLNSDFASNTFTAPVTGKYQLQLTARIDQIDRDANWVRIEMVTSNREYSANIIDPDAFDKDPDYWSINFGVLADMDANDTVFLRWGQSGGSNTADFDTQAHFSGYLVC